LTGVNPFFWQSFAPGSATPLMTGGYADPAAAAALASASEHQAPRAALGLGPEASNGGRVRP